MKKENLLKIFGTEHPSVQKYQNWVLNTNPETFRPWNPPLNSQEKTIISDPELVKKPHGRNYFGTILVETEEWNAYQDKYLPIESAGLIINFVREAKKENLSGESILSYLSKLEEFQKNCISESWKYRWLLHNQVKQVLAKHGMFLNEVNNNLKQAFLERKNEIFKNLSEWRTQTGRNEIWKTDGSGTHVNKEWFENKEDFESLQKDIMQRETDDFQKKVEEIKSNPQVWKLFKVSKLINLPWASNLSYIERKDGKEKFYENEFNQQQWKEIEKAVKKDSIFFFLFLIFLIAFFFLFFYRWHKRKKKKSKVEKHNELNKLLNKRIVS